MATVDFYTAEAYLPTAAIGSASANVWWDDSILTRLDLTRIPTTSTSVENLARVFCRLTGETIPALAASYVGPLMIQLAANCFQDPAQMNGNLHSVLVNPASATTAWTGVKIDDIVPALSADYTSPTEEQAVWRTLFKKEAASEKEKELLQHVSAGHGTKVLAYIGYFALYTLKSLAKDTPAYIRTDGRVSTALKNFHNLYGGDVIFTEPLFSEDFCVRINYAYRSSNRMLWTLVVAAATRAEVGQGDNASSAINSAFYKIIEHYQLPLFRHVTEACDLMGIEISDLFDVIRYKSISRSINSMLTCYWMYMAPEEDYRKMVAKHPNLALTRRTTHIHWKICRLFNDNYLKALGRKNNSALILLCAALKEVVTGNPVISNQSFVRPQSVITVEKWLQVAKAVSEHFASTSGAGAHSSELMQKAFGKGTTEVKQPVASTSGTAATPPPLVAPQLPVVVEEDAEDDELLAQFEQ